MAKNIVKKIIGWAGILYFIFSIYLITVVSIEGLMPFTNFYFNYNMGFIGSFILAISFKVLAIKAIYLWKK